MPGQVIVRPFVRYRLNQPIQISGAHHHRRVHAHPADRDDQSRDVQMGLYGLLQLGDLFQAQIGQHRNIFILANGLARRNNQRHRQRRDMIQGRRNSLPAQRQPLFGKNTGHLALDNIFSQRPHFSNGLIQFGLLRQQFGRRARRVQYSRVRINGCNLAADLVAFCDMVQIADHQVVLLVRGQVIRQPKGPLLNFKPQRLQRPGNVIEFLGPRVTQHLVIGYTIPGRAACQKNCQSTSND